MLSFADSSGNLRDTIKTLPEGTVDELENALYDIHVKKQKSAENKIAKNDVNKVISGDRDPIDFYYNLDPNSPSYDVDRRRAEVDFANRPAISDDDRKAIDSAILGLQDLDLIDLEQFGGIPIVGKTVAEISQIFGISEAMAEFLAGRQGLLVNSVDALVRGIPSDFDVRNILSILPNPSLAVGTNEIRVDRLDKIFKDIIINKVKFELQMGRVVPFNYIDAAISAGGDGMAAELLNLIKGGGDRDRMDYISKIGLVEGFTKQGYIDTFGDPFKSSKKLIDDFDADGDKPEVLTDEQKRELEEFRKQFGMIN
tara:strand:- start:88 stop:1023 length:936 start_codon:yes stop_codon:yes gene_type:complete